MARGTKTRGTKTRGTKTKAKTKTNIGANKIGGKWSMKYKKSINCKHPKGFSQKQHCKYGRKTLKL